MPSAQSSVKSWCWSLRRHSLSQRRWGLTWVCETSGMLHVEWLRRFQSSYFISAALVQVDVCQCESCYTTMSTLPVHVIVIVHRKHSHYNRLISTQWYRQADRIAHVQWHVHAIAYMLSCVEILCICLSSSNIHSAHFSKLWSILHGNALSAADTYLWHIAFSVLSWHWCIAWVWAAVIHCLKAWLLCVLVQLQPLS